MSNNVVVEENSVLLLAVLRPRRLRRAVRLFLIFAIVWERWRKWYENIIRNGNLVYQTSSKFDGKKKRNSKLLEIQKHGMSTQNVFLLQWISLKCEYCRLLNLPERWEEEFSESETQLFLHVKSRWSWRRGWITLNETSYQFMFIEKQSLKNYVIWNWRRTFSWSLLRTFALDDEFSLCFVTNPNDSTWIRVHECRWDERHWRRGPAMLKEIRSPRLAVFYVSNMWTISRKSHILDWNERWKDLKKIEQSTNPLDCCMWIFIICACSKWTTRRLMSKIWINRWFWFLENKKECPRKAKKIAFVRNRTGDLLWSKRC